MAPLTAPRPLAALVLTLVITGVGCASPPVATTRLAVSPATPPDVAAVITRMPARNRGEEDRLSGELLGLGSPALGYVCSMVGTWGTTDDTAARYALGALTRYVADPQREADRAIYSAVLIDALAAQENPESGAFLIAQLQLVGRDEAVAPLGTVLADERLGGIATRALQAIGTPAVEHRLIAALDGDDAAHRVAILTALGQLRSHAAVAGIRPYVASDDPATRDAARSAIANIGAPEALELLLNDASNSDNGPAPADLLQLARRRHQAGDTEQTVRIARWLMNSSPQASESHVQIAALQLLHAARGEGSRAELAAAAAGDNAELRHIATRLIRKLDADDTRRQETADGFVPLFNGIDLSGWRANDTSYLVDHGSIIVDPRRPGSGDLYTEREFRDFALRFEFKLTPGANNGLAIRAPAEGDSAYLGMELQILDEHAAAYADLKPWQAHGSIYGVAAARRGAQRPVGEWNEQEVIVDGRHVTVILNEVTILDVDLDAIGDLPSADGRDHPGLRRATGHLGFVGHGQRAEFRHIRIKEFARPGE